VNNGWTKKGCVEDQCVLLNSDFVGSFSNWDRTYHRVGRLYM